MNVLVANLISSIRVCIKHKSFKSRTRHSRHVESIIKKFQSLGVIKNYETFNLNATPYVSFNINILKGMPMLYEIKIISKPGRKIYSSVKDLKAMKGIHVDLIVSTSHGIMNYKECVMNNIGGEVICSYL